ncbi:hypothetical protein ACQZ4Q_08100 [Agrobacterium vitis]
MRISAQKGHPFHNDILHLYLRVFLNGRECDNCLFADEETGTVERLRIGSDGLLLTQNGHFVSETVSGSVKLVLKDGAPSAAWRELGRLRSLGI